MMTASAENWGPKEARDALAKSAGNRSTRKHRVSVYAKDMTAGRWMLQPHGPVFGSDDRLYDGHHTATAIIAAGVTVCLWVTRGMDYAAAAVLDSGLPRSAADAFAMAGKGEYTPTLLATALSIDLWPRTAATGGCEAKSRSDLLDVIAEYAEALTFACEETRGHQYGWSRSSRGLMARAWYHADRGRLNEFAQVVRSALPISANAQDDSAALLYGRYLKVTCSQSGSGVELDRYRRGQYALRRFLAREATTKLFAVDDDVFPMPQNEA